MNTRGLAAKKALWIEPALNYAWKAITGSTSTCFRRAWDTDSANFRVRETAKWNLGQTRLATDNYYVLAY